MAVTDLTGTKWLLNPSISGYFGTKNITFTSNGNNYSSIRLDDVELDYGSTLAGSFNKSGDFTWSSESYRTISITGGTDATNADLIAWLQANATQIQDEPTNTFSFGNLPIVDMYFGTQQVKKVYLGNALVWEKETSANLISFTIDSTTYQAESGMTWAEWVASSYNTGGYYVSGSRCLSSAGGVVYYDAQTEVKTGIEIVANHIYIAVIAPGGGGGGSDN